MIDARTQALLQNLVRRASRSMLQYVGDSHPWAGDGEAELLIKLRAVIDGEEQAIEDFAGFLRKTRIGIPYLGPYPEPFTSINYVSVDYLMPRLIDWQRRWVTALETDLTQIADAEAKAAVQKLLDAGRRDLATLEQMAATHAKAGAH